MFPAIASVVDGKTEKKGRVRQYRIRMATSVMIEKFAGARGLGLSKFLDLNHTSKSMILVSLMIPKFAPEPAARTGELRNRDTRANSRPAVHLRFSHRHPRRRCWARWPTGRCAGASQQSAARRRLAGRRLAAS